MTETDIIEVDRQQSLIECLQDATSLAEAGRRAGYSDSYCRCHIYELVRSEKFQDKLRKHYRTQTGVLLPKIIKAEADLVNLVLLDPEKLSKHNNTIKQLKQAAGVIESDEAPRATFINIRNLRELSLHVLNKPPEQIQDATIIEDMQA